MARFAWSLFFVIWSLCFVFGRCDLSAIDLNEIAKLIKASEQRILSTTTAALQKSEQRILSTIRDESHLFMKQSVAAGTPCVERCRDVTGFGVVYKGRAYHIVPAHMDGIDNFRVFKHKYADLAILSSARESKDCPLLGNIFFFWLDKLIAKPSMGDNLFAIGYDILNPEVGLRIWAGVVNAVYLSVVTDIKFYTNDNNNQQPINVYRKFILTGGESVRGMSGSPVFNGCGMAGIGVGNDYRVYENITANSGALVVHVEHLLELLDDANAPEFAVDMPEETLKFCEINIKSYC